MQFPSLRTRPALTLLSALALATTLMPARAIAQDDDDDGVRTRVFSFNNHARIGVMVDLKADAENDRIGARLNGVTPDGPADKAGLKDGDIITRFNGTALGGISAKDEDQSGPGEKLVALAQKLDDGDSVAVEYRRGKDTRKATIVAKDLSMAGNYRFSMPGGMSMWRTPAPGGMFHSENDMPFIVNAFGMGRGGLELTELSPELGEYFGAKSGILVLKTPTDSTLALRAGDVIVAIDGRTPSSESQVHRILQSYDGGETAHIEVLRKQKKVTVNWTVPKMEGRMLRTTRPRVKVERS